MISLALAGEAERGDTQPLAEEGTGFSIYAPLRQQIDCYIRGAAQEESANLWARLQEQIAMASFEELKDTVLHWGDRQVPEPFKSVIAEHMLRRISQHITRTYALRTDNSRVLTDQWHVYQRGLTYAEPLVQIALTKDLLHLLSGDRTTEIVSSLEATDLMRFLEPIVQVIEKMVPILPPSEQWERLQDLRVKLDTAQLSEQALIMIQTLHGVRQDFSQDIMGRVRTLIPLLKTYQTDLEKAIQDLPLKILMAIGKRQQDATCLPPELLKIIQAYVKASVS